MKSSQENVVVGQKVENMKNDDFDQNFGEELKSNIKDRIEKLLLEGHLNEEK